MVMETEVRYKYQVSLGELRKPALVKDCGSNRKELERQKAYLERLQVRFAEVGGKIHVEDASLDD